jgi:hypothetical protein
VVGRHLRPSVSKQKPLPLCSASMPCLRHMAGQRHAKTEGYSSVRMWAWIIVVLVLFAIGALVALLRARGTLYVFRNNGFTAFSAGGRSQSHHTSADGLLKAINRLLPGDVFDMLWVSTRDDDYTGLILTVESGAPTLTVDFKTHGEQAKRESFKKAMAAGGFIGTEDSNGFSGGSGEEFRVTTIEYQLSRTPDMILAAVELAFSALDSGAADGYFLKGSSLAAIVGSRPGVKFVPASDPLSDL